jgi:hypothetical protein
MFAAAMIALCAILTGQANAHGKESVRVYVFATEAARVADGTTTDDARKARLEAVRDLRDAIRHQRGLSVVDDRGQADVVVEVTDCEQQDAGEGGFGGVKLTPLVTTTIRLHVTSGEQATDMKGFGPGTGSRAAKDAAERLLKWIARNHLDRVPAPTSDAALRECAAPVV